MPLEYLNGKRLAQGCSWSNAYTTEPPANIIEMIPESSQTRVAIFGATPDSANLGVSALYESILTGLCTVFNDLEVVVFDNQLGCREQWLSLSKGRQIRVIKFGARGGFRVYRPENLLNMLVCSKLGFVGSKFNHGIRLLRSCDVVLDISGGDSFSDIYGIKRFNNMYRQKKLVLDLRKPLVLLPQTYGPYQSKKVFAKASRVTKLARLAWARDEDSFEILKQLLGSHFDPEIHKRGVDVAFGLKPVLESNSLPPQLKVLLSQEKRSRPLAGINVSGLIYNNPDRARERYGLKVDYDRLMFDLVRAFIDRTNCHIVLVPHVVEEVGHYESDISACNGLLDSFSHSAADRISLAPSNLSASSAKGLIAELDWFCGTRMHATIAALSSGVPTATIVYSDKAKGVFATCNQERFAFDPRTQSADEIIAGVLSAYDKRDRIHEELREVAIRITKQAIDPFYRISELLESCGEKN